MMVGVLANRISRVPGAPGDTSVGTVGQQLKHFQVG